MIIMKICEKLIKINDKKEPALSLGYSVLTIDRLLGSDVSYRLINNFITLYYSSRRNKRDKVIVTEHTKVKQIDSDNILDLRVHSRFCNLSASDTEKLINETNKFVENNIVELYNAVPYCVDNDVYWDDACNKSVERTYSDLNEFVEHENFIGLLNWFKDNKAASIEDKLRLVQSHIALDKEYQKEFKVLNKNYNRKDNYIHENFVELDSVHTSKLDF